jgi:enamine deaminase RidA (YjgF/YER057c/UK114 family)
VSSTRHTIVNPPVLVDPVGFAHAVAAAPGRLVALGGQTGTDAAGSLVGAGLVEQFDAAAANVVTALAAAGGTPGDILSMQIFVTDVPGYRARLGELGAAWRRRFGHHYPATGLFGVTELFEQGAMVELMATAVVSTTGER